MAKQVVARVDDELHRRIKTKAASQGKTMTTVFKELLERWIEDDDSTENDNVDKGPVT